MAAYRAARQSRAWLLGGLGSTAAACMLPGMVLADKKKDDDVRGPLFDPEALERGAKALREINASPHAKQVRSKEALLYTCQLHALGTCACFVELGPVGHNCLVDVCV